MILNCLIQIYQNLTYIMKNKKISKKDKKNYLKIRKNVENFLKKQSKYYDSDLKIILDIAPQIHKGSKEFFVKSKIMTADIDKNSNSDFIIDICQNNENLIKSETFDVVICTEVLEHTKNPFSAINEIYRILKNDAILLITTPFDFRIHGPLPDCWRFTEHGLRELLKKFKNIEIVGLENKKRFLMPLHYTIKAIK